MEQQIRYAKTEDGVDIAFTVYGEGIPIVVPPNLMLSHVDLETLNPTTRGFFIRLSKRLQVIRYDPRGMGMSQRGAADFSIEAAERDLAAVVDKLALDRFALYSHILAGESAMSFTAKHPERVACVVWWIGQSLNSSPATRRQAAALNPLMDGEWELYLNVLGRLVHGWDSPIAATYPTIALAGSSPETRRLASRAIRQGVAFDWATRVPVPALVSHLSGAEQPTNSARSLAASMPAARLIAVPGPPGTWSPFVDDNEILIAAIADFVEGTWSGGSAAAKAPELQLGAMRAILWTDIVEHTPLMHRQGDAAGRELLRDHERITRDALQSHGGTEVKAMGDGFMAWFGSAAQALDCAVALQRAFAERNAAAAEPMLARVGVNAGEPIIEEDDLFGTSVIAAARICREANGGEIIASDVVRQLVAGKGFLFADRGAVALKGFEEAMRLYEVRWQA